MPDPGLDPILAYLREHSGRYSLPALRGQLLQAGYDRKEVDRALAIYQQENAAMPPVPVWPKALLVLVVNLLVATFGILSFKKDDNILLFSTVLIVGVEFLGGIVLLLGRKSRVWGSSLLAGCALFVALLILAVGGFCIKLVFDLKS